MAASAAKWRQRARPQDDDVASHGVAFRDRRVVLKGRSMLRKRAQGKPNRAGRRRAKKRATLRPAASAGAGDRMGKRSPIALEQNGRPAHQRAVGRALTGKLDSFSPQWQAIALKGQPITIVAGQSWEVRCFSPSWQVHGPRLGEAWVGRRVKLKPELLLEPAGC